MSLSKQGLKSTDDDVFWKLLYSQKEAARFLHIGYLSLREFPDVAEQIRSTADQAQTQHMMTVGLIKEFKITANHVVSRTIRLLTMAIEKKATKMVQATLQKLLGYVEQMIERTKETKKEYAIIKSNVQSNISLVTKKKCAVMEENTKIDSALSQQMQALEVAGSEYLDLKAQREKAEKEISELYKERQNFLDKAVPSQTEKEQNAAIDNMVLPGFALAAGGLAKSTAVAAAGTTVAFSAAILPGAILVGGWMMNYMRRKDESDRAFKASDKVAEDLKLKQERDDKDQARILAIKEDSIKKIAMIKENFVRKAFIGDPKCLVQAQRQLENVSEQFENILASWIHFAAHLNHLAHNKDDVDILFIGFEENPESLKAEFNDSVENIKEVWQGFMDDCTGYQEKSDEVKDQLYGFLTEPVDALSIEECDRKRDAILAKMESDLEKLITGTKKYAVLDR